ncbi:IS3 family transposase [Chryseobacterium fluminis]|uniref:IS3 family transposase n=1 Tax=Chryseobacterium fluminis TaxID=2983606 RepID=UPI0022532C07|nr:IS3 family transposase [Chryseobacterium sp. MMS21-Ot14]UZT97934.1 IS3 family transposase [Chryseobacterium sp. MMS21-Ot14]
MKKERKIYDPALKTKAVQLSNERTNISELARELGIAVTLLYKWRKEYEEFGQGSFPGNGNLKLTPEQEKIHELEKKLKDAELERDILKKGNRHLLPERSMKYEFIKNNESIFPIEKMCYVLKLSSSGYYKWKNRSFSKKLLLKEKIKEQITSIYFSSKQRYRSPRIRFELNSLGYKISRITVAKYMKELGLRSKLSKKFKVTTNLKHNYLVVENLLNRNFIAEKPVQAWVSDITYIQTKEGFLYLTTVIDLYDQKIIGWSLSNGMSTEETSLAAWKMAVGNRKIADGLIFHSDRGIQYASRKFTNTLKFYEVTRSMSRKGNCWDNAVAESFFKSLKTELIYGNKLITKEKMKLEIFEYIEVWYNKKRRHSTLNYQTIEEFNNQNKM